MFAKLPISQVKEQLQWLYWTPIEINGESDPGRRYK